jgi:hypothetical protein
MPTNRGLRGKLVSDRSSAASLPPGKHIRAKLSEQDRPALVSLRHQQLAAKLAPAMNLGMAAMAIDVRAREHAEVEIPLPPKEESRTRSSLSMVGLERL